MADFSGCEHETARSSQTAVRTLHTARPFIPQKCSLSINHLTPNSHYMGRTAQLTSRRYILNIYSTNIRTEYFKHAA